MKPINQKNYEILKILSRMPGNILLVHGIDNVLEFVLHDLCNEECFNLSRAAYFVDNPDFDFLKGVAGFSDQEVFLEAENIWSVPEQFSIHMQDAPFNKKVRLLAKSSPKRSCVCDLDVVNMLAEELHFNNPAFVCWKLKHDNHGMLLYEHENRVQDWSQEDLTNACHLLGLCPIF